MDLVINLDRAGAQDGSVENPGLPHCRQILYSLDFPGGSVGKASAYNVKDLVGSLGWEDPLEKEMATHSSTLAWKIPWTEEPGRLQSMELESWT